jgi:hypothetical protein
LEKRLSFDTKLLQQPIQVTLGLKSSDKFMEITHPESLTNLKDLTDSLKDLSFQSFQQGLSDQSLSLRNELLANPRFSVGLPFQYVQDMKFNVLEGQQDQYFVNITSMLNADLTTIQFALQWDQDLKNTNNARFCPFQFIRMLDVQLLLNGQRLHNYDEDSYPYVYLANTLSQHWAAVQSAPYMKVDKQAEPQRYVRQTNQCAIYEINFSRLRACAMEAHMMNTPRFTNQTMQLSFRIDRDVPNFVPRFDSAANPNLVLLTSYYYNAVFMVGQDGGQSKLITA